MKIVFLDIDGVLNSNDWYVRRSTEVKMDDIAAQYPFYEFDPDAVKRLNRLTDLTGAKIVVSSTWRHGRDVDQLKLLFSQVGITGEVIDRTPSMHISGKESGYTVPRGCEIDKWLDDHDFQRINWSKERQQEYLDKSQIQNYIILDDDSDMLYNQREHFIKCPHLTGFSRKELREAIKILNTSVIDLYYPKN
jgi:hypothetical protein